MTREVARALGSLSPREEAVIRLRFGIGQGEPMTLEEVGRTLAVTCERIRQIEEKGLMKLRAPEFQQLLRPLLYALPRFITQWRPLLPFSGICDNTTVALECR